MWFTSTSTSSVNIISSLRIMMKINYEIRLNYCVLLAWQCLAWYPHDICTSTFLACYKMLISPRWQPVLPTTTCSCLPCELRYNKQIHTRRQTPHSSIPSFYWSGVGGGGGWGSLSLSLFVAGAITLLISSQAGHRAFSHSNMYWGQPPNPPNIPPQGWFLPIS